MDTIATSASATSALAFGVDPRTPEPEPQLGVGLGLAELKAELFGTRAPVVRVDRYRVIEELGRGGMGVVYRGLDEELGRAVALKLLPTTQASSTEASARLAREARALARVSHPSVVQIYDIGELDGSIWVAMELIEGQTLRTWLAQLEPVGPRWRAMLPVFIEVGAGIAAAHEVGLIHRDIKPENIMVTRSGARVLDFGLARLDAELDEPSLHSGAELDADKLSRSGPAGLETLTRAGQIPGTPAYMAPEQFEGRRADARSDQFSFCVALWEAVYGARPFASHERSLAHLREGVCAGLLDPSPRAAAPRWLEAALRRGLAVSPSERWPSMEALLELLRERPQRRRRIAQLGLAGVSVVGALLLAREGGPEPCAIDATALLGTWDEPRRQTLREAFASSELAFASSATAAAEARLDAWAEDWVGAQRRACEATRVSGVQSEAVLDLRTACLARKRAEFSGLLDVLAVTPAALGRVEEVLAELPELDACEGGAGLEQRFVLPEGPDRARALANIEALAEARIMANADMHAEVEGVLAALEPSINSLAHLPLSLQRNAVEAELMLARNQLDAGAERMLATIREAEVFELDELVASWRVSLAATLAGAWSKPELEAMILADADVALRRLERPPGHRALILHKARAYALRARDEEHAALAELEAAHVLGRDIGDPQTEWMRLDLAASRVALGQYDEAEADILAARDAARAEWGPRSPALGLAEHVFATLELQRERLDEARAHTEAALAITLPLFGPRSLQVARSRLIEAKLAMFEGEFAAALERVTALVEIYSEALGPEHYELVELHNAVGVLRYFTGDLSGSITAYERALAINILVRGQHHRQTALLHSNIGESQLALGRHALALAAFERALAAFAALAAPDDPLLALPLKGRGLAALELGELEAARADLERALAIAEHTLGEPLERAEIRAALARTLVEQGAAPARARALVEQAATELRALGLSERASEVEASLD